MGRTNAASRQRSVIPNLDGSTTSTLWRRPRTNTTPYPAATYGSATPIYGLASPEAASVHHAVLENSPAHQTPRRLPEPGPPRRQRRGADGRPGPARRRDLTLPPLADAGLLQGPTLLIGAIF